MSWVMGVGSVICVASSTCGAELPPALSVNSTSDNVNVDGFRSKYLKCERGKVFHHHCLSLKERLLLQVLYYSQQPSEE